MKVRTLLGPDRSRNAPRNAAAGTRLRLFAQSAQAFQAGAVAFRRDLQVARNVSETLVIHQPAKGERPDLALADVLVPIHPGAQRLHAVVEMEGLDERHAQHAIESLECRLVAAVGADVVPGSEDVAGIEADRHPLRALAQVAHGPQLLESASQAG